jgi:site-specific recombinase XerD
MAHPQDDESVSINRRDTATVRADYARWLAEQPLSSRTREAYLAAVTAFVAWLEQREAGPGDAFVAPRARDVAARDYKRHMKVDRGLSPASVNQALAGMDHLFRFLGTRSPASSPPGAMSRSPASASSASPSARPARDATPRPVRRSRSLPAVPRSSPLPPR